MTTTHPEITETVARKVLEVVDTGLVKGVGQPIPGQMCVEAAVCFALGLPHGDEPGCVAPVLRSLKIRLNDSAWSSNQARAKGLRRLALAQLGSAGTLDEAEFRHRIVDNAIGSTVPRAMRIAASIQKNPKHKAALIAAADKCEREHSREAALEARKAADAAADAAAYAAAAYAAATYAAAAADAAADATYADAAAYAAAAYAAATYAAATYAAAAAAADAAAAKSARDKSLADYAEDVVQILIAMNAPGCQWLALAPLEI